jgi:curved DNA-binding protein
MKNYYDMLGVDEKATSAEISKAYKNLAKQHHPDRGGDKDKFQEINEAHDTLKDARKRQEYDTIRKYGQPGTGGNFSFRSGDFFGEEIFEDFFSGFNFQNPHVRTRTFRSGPRRNKSVNVRMAVSIKEAMNNMEKTISYKLPSGKEEFATVKIPAGVQNGVTFKYSGMGDDSIKNVPRGDLLVQMTVLDSDGYTRQGNDLHTTKTISCFEAIRGCELQLKTLTESVIKVKVPAGTQPGTLINCKGQGMPVHKTLNIRGNLYVKVMVLIPQLSAQDLKKIKDL